MNTQKTPLNLAFLLAALVLAPEGAAQGGAGHGGGGGGGTPAPDPAILFTNSGGIYACNADGSNPTLVLAGASTSALLSPSWSPDGTKVVFNGRLPIPGGYQEGIYVVDRNGANLQPVVLLQRGSSNKPVWSPVATPAGTHKLAFTAPPAGTTLAFEIFLVNTDGSGLQQLTSTPGAESYVSWSRDGRSLVVADLDLSGVSFQDCYVLDLEADGVGGLRVAGRRELLNVPGSPLRAAWHSTAVDLAWPEWARTQDKVALAVLNLPGGQGWDLWIVDVANPLNATRVPGASKVHERQPSWSPDDGLLAHWNSKGGIRVVKPDGTGLVQLTSSGMMPDWRR